MKLRNILGFCLLLTPLLSFSQLRESEPLPIFTPTPYFSVSDSIAGWSYSSDGQWVQWPNIIPAIGISRNEKFYEAKHNQFGIDNIKNISAYHVKYDKDTLICLVKTFQNGEYKYPARQRGWDSYLDAYYCILNYHDLKKALDYFEAENDEEVHVLRIKTLDSKLLSDIKEKDIIENIIANAIVKPNYDRNLVLTIRNNKRDKSLLFHISNLHEIFNDVEGVRQPFSRNGRSLYGSVNLFNYLYFEMDKSQFFEILKLKEALMRAEIELMFEAPLEDDLYWDSPESEAVEDKQGDNTD